jgi:transcriptional regulator of acetoin/glycerol metabolism
MLTFAEAICEADEITVHHLPQECATHRWESPSLLNPMQAKRPEYMSVNMLADNVALSEQQMLLDTLRDHRWNISAVAKKLRISRPTVYRRMKKHNIILPKDVLE